MFYGPLIIILNTVLVAYSYSNFGTFNEPSTPRNFQRFLPSRRYIIRNKLINYQTDVGRMFENVIKIEISSPHTLQYTTSQRTPVERVRHHHNEVINILRRRTNIFMDVVSNTPHEQQSSKWPGRPRDTISDFRSYTLIDPYNFTDRRLFPQPTSLSDVASNGISQLVKHGISKIASDSKLSIQRRSLFQSSRNNITAYETKKITQNQSKFLINNVKPVNDEVVLLKYLTYTYFKTTPSLAIVNNKSDTLNSDKTERNISHTRRCKEYYGDDKIYTTTRTNNSSTSKPDSNILTTPASKDDVSSTNSKFNDKIKFFEVYDINTSPMMNYEDWKNIETENNTNVNQEIDMEPINGRLNSPKVNMRKKRIEPFEENYRSEDLLEKLCGVVLMRHITTDSLLPPSLSEEHSYHPFISYHSADDSKLQNAASQISAIPTIKLNQSRAISWAEYPFIAVYVYERFQVHCDAGVISRHWLVAAGSCLSRHRKELTGDTRSAFVISCVDNWWDAQRINYVKYSLIHPQFSQKDPVRRRLYNVGLIKVAASMSSLCKNWAPVQLISHQYKGNNKDSIASAIGWGLDRYHTAYSLSDLPQRPLSIYNGLVFSNRCPGRQAKYSEEENSNVYCLTLPPYSIEEDDPTHGGLLMVEGSLVALYLQEERRSSGDQSAQYTGIWRLVPWIMDVATEPYEDQYS